MSDRCSLSWLELGPEYKLLAGLYGGGAFGERPKRAAYFNEFSIGGGAPDSIVDIEGVDLTYGIDGLAHHGGYLYACSQVGNRFTKHNLDGTLVTSDVGFVGSMGICASSGGVYVWGQNQNSPYPYEVHALNDYTLNVSDTLSLAGTISQGGLAPLYATPNNLYILDVNDKAVWRCTSALSNLSKVCDTTPLLGANTGPYHIAVSEDDAYLLIFYAYNNGNMRIAAIDISGTPTLVEYRTTIFSWGMNGSGSAPGATTFGRTCFFQPLYTSDIYAVDFTDGIVGQVTTPFDSSSIDAFNGYNSERASLAIVPIQYF